MGRAEEGPGGNTPDIDAWLRAELDGLDGDTYQASGYPGFNGLMSMYQQLPEHRIAATIGSVVCVVFDDGDFMEMQPVAAYGDFVIARDLEKPIQEQDVPEYVVLGGSILLDEMYVSVHGSDLLVPAISKAIEKGRKADSFVPELNTGFIYRPGVFCHSARLATAQAYTMDELRQTHMKRKTRQSPIYGSVITVGMNGKDTVLFVDEPFDLTLPVRQVEVPVDDEIIQVLQYVDDD